MRTETAEREANRRSRQRYKVLRLLGLQAPQAQRACHGSAKFRDALEAMGVDPAKHRELWQDRRRLSHWERVRTSYGLPRYAGAVRIERVISRPKAPVHPDLGDIRGPLRSVLIAAGVVRSEDGNTP